MIIDEYVEITLNSNQVYDAIQYWTEKGYANLRPQQKLLVKVADLPKFSSTKVLFKCDDCGIKWKRRYSKKFANKNYDKDLCRKCSRLDVGKRVGRDNAIKAGKRNCGSNHHNWNPNKTEFKEYAYKVRRITEETYASNKDKINPDNYPRTLCGIENGYQLDHIVSIKWGYLHGVNPKAIGGIGNLQMLSWEENREKFY
jgi:hypothetical protein